MLSEMKTRRAIYIQPKIQRFSGRDEAAMVETLRNMDENTSLRSPADMSEFQLDRDGKTVKGGFRFTAPAFNQAAQMLAPGLSKLLPDLAGTATVSDDKDQLVDSAAAIKFWNDIVDLRFPLFQRHRLIRNEKEKTIEGLVGHTHQYLENWALYQEAATALRQQGLHAEMYAATLVGRLFSVWFRVVEPLFVTAVAKERWGVYHGFYFTNGEATGTAVRGTNAVFTPKGVCLGNYRRYGKRVTHTGRDFPMRLMQAFSDVCQIEMPVETLQKGVGRLAIRSLGFSASQSKTARADRIKKIAISLSGCGVIARLANEVVELGLGAGRCYGGGDIEISRYINTPDASRTLLDLYVPLLGMARKVDTRQREKLECAAFNILTNKFTL